MERLADNALDRAHTRFIVSSDPQEIVEKIQPYIDLGFTELVFHFPGNDQRRYIDEFADDVFPLLPPGASNSSSSPSTPSPRRRPVSATSTTPAAGPRGPPTSPRTA